MNTVRERRQAVGLSQQKLAEHAGLSLRTVAYIESEKENGRGVKLDTLLAIAEVLDCTLSDLVPTRKAS